MAVEFQSEITDGVVQYDYQNRELFGAGFTTGTVENPSNPFIEVFRLPQGERGEINCKCYENGDCPFWIESEDDYCGGHFDEDITDECGNNRITCCIDAYIDVDFDRDFEDNFNESVEEQIRDVLSDHLGSTISKLNEIRIAISDRLSPYNYFEVRNDEWEMDILDCYVDYAVSNGFTTNVEPREYLDAEIQHLVGLCEDRCDDTDYWNKVAKLIREHDFDGALEMLQ